jgi:hypothetical protein
LFKRLNGIFIEAESEAAHDAKNVACAILSDDRFENNRSLVSRLTSFFGILRLNALNNAWRSNTTAYSENAAAKTAAFTRTNTWTFAFTNAAP